MSVPRCAQCEQPGDETTLYWWRHDGKFCFICRDSVACSARLNADQEEFREAVKRTTLRAFRLKPWHIGLGPVPRHVRLWRKITFARWRVQRRLNLTGTAPMPWQNTPDKRRRDAAVYSDPEYRKNRPLAWARAGGRCELITGGRRCGSRKRCQVDHIINLAAGGTHHLDNLRVLCGPHHDEKTATEGGGYRRRRRAPDADPPLQGRTSW